VSAAPSAKIEIICTKLDNAVGFSNGCAALALKKPPPLVPSILIESGRPPGRRRWFCLAPSSVVASNIGAERLRNALPDQEQRVDDADRHQDISVQRVTSTQKLPMVRIDDREKPRISATASAMAGCRRQEILVRQPQHLHEIGQRAFAAVILPIGVGDEADRGIEGKILATADCSAGLNGNTACSRITA